MLKDIILPPDRHYENKTSFEPIQFYIEGLMNSVRWDLLLGYFSSAAINVLSLGFATFISKGGCVRLVLNNVLSQNDKEVFESINYIGSELEFDLENVAKLKETLSSYDKHFFECLRYLIKHNRIEFKVISPKDSDGIAHYKSGIFHDKNGDKIHFNGSCNLTAYGLLKNLEEINVDTSWDNELSSMRVHNAQKRLDDIFAERIDYINYIDITKVKTQILEHINDKSIDELLISEKELLEQKQRFFNSTSNLQNFINKVEKEIDRVITEPKFPYAEGPREYQKIAFENWKNNNQKGLFAMATGTGKTITSLNCLLEIYKRKGYYKAIILVPTITLVNQWEQECLKFRFSNIVKVYSKNSNWGGEVERIQFNERYTSEKESECSFIIISTYASYSKTKVFDMLNGFDKRKTLVIADECHNISSDSMLKKLKEIPYLRRIGLSATPDRQFDERGTQKLRKFFGAEEKYTYEYLMEEAIKNGVLCKYLYYPHIIRLTSTEMEAYVELSEKIAKYFNYSSGTFENIDEILKMLLLARKRIIHKAVNKLQEFKNIIDIRLKKKGNLKYTLVYVPEGNNPDFVGNEDVFDQDESIMNDSETDHLIDTYTQVVVNADSRTTVRKFVSGQKDRESILEDFASGKLHVLTSMKCLDEGVDVPRSELAIFCSSTGNPRQFIQRRGRILRTHPDKKYAELHDLVVVPEISCNCSSYKMEQSLLKAELNRVKNFALLSENPSYSELELREIMNYYGLNLYNNEYIK